MGRSMCVGRVGGLAVALEGVRKDSADDDDADDGSSIRFNFQPINSQAPVVRRDTYRQLGLLEPATVDV